MPAKSKAQFRAMQAAAHGRSTLGIPKKVGQEFVSATATSYKKLPARKSKKAKPARTHRVGRGQAKVMTGTRGLKPDPAQQPDSSAVRRKSAGLRAREREVADLREAAEGGSYQARVRLRPATSALRRQKAQSKRRGY